MRHRRLVRLSLVCIVLLLLAPLASAAPPVLTPATASDINGIPISPPGYLLASGASGNRTYATSSDSYTELISCTINVPRAGYLLISTDSSLADEGSSYITSFGIKINSDFVPGMYRTVTNSDGQQRGMALSFVRPVTPGIHTVRLMYKRLAGSALATVRDPSLSVLYIPASSPAKGIAVQQTETFTTTSTGYRPIITNTIINVQPGWLYVTSDAQVTYNNGNNQVFLNLALDALGASTCCDRSVSSTSVIAGYKSVAYSALFPLPPGNHIFWLLAARMVGTAAARLDNVTLSGVFIPEASGIITASGKYGQSNWGTSSTTFSAVRSVTLALPADSWVYISANASLEADDNVTAHLRLGIDENTTGDSATDRWTNIYPVDNPRESTAISIIRWLPAGPHTFYYLARVTTANGSLNVTDATLTVIIPGGHTLVPLVRK